VVANAVIGASEAGLAGSVCAKAGLAAASAKTLEALASKILWEAVDRETKPAFMGPLLCE
jgi:hypothetical protein